MRDIRVRVVQVGDGDCRAVSRLQACKCKCQCL
jgi:hypothetical protein